MDSSLSAPFDLRSFRPADLEALFALDVECFPEPFRFSRATLRRLTSDANARVFILAGEEALGGFAILHLERLRARVRVGYITTLDVAAAWRGRGLGRWLMEAMEAEARVAGCVALVLHVFTGNDAAVCFYERLGFVRVELAAGFYRHDLDAWIYRKDLHAGTGA